jgi:type I restriction-modification system DNA methylase subunit
VNDGSLLFLQHMISKFEPVLPDQHKHGSRLAIVFSGSPLFTGGAGSGESDIRKWIIENDWLEAIIALPVQIFYNTGIGTYIWIVTNRKENRRKGKIQRDFETVPLKDDVDAYFEREVRPHVPDAWMDRSKDKVGYEINFNRHFYRYTPPRPLEEIDAELKQAEEEIMRLLREVTS